MLNILQSNKDETIYFIASTLPLKYIKEDKKKKKIIIACGSDLAQSCQSIFKNNKKYTILNISRNKIIQLFQLLFLLIIRNKKSIRNKIFFMKLQFLYSMYLSLFLI